MKHLEKALLIAFILTVAFSFSAFAGRCEDIPNHVLRLHILANSDSAQDQQLKLQVRDRLLRESAGMLDGAKDRDSAEQIVSGRLSDLQRAAADEIRKRGYDYPVQVRLENLYFTTRQYEKVTLPAGRYDALRVTIGSAKGKNWWCVMFPPMCLPAAEEKEELDDVLNPEQMKIVTGDGEYEIRFKSLELYEQLRDWAESLKQPRDGAEIIEQPDGAESSGQPRDVDESSGQPLNQAESAEQPQK